MKLKKHLVPEVIHVIDDGKGYTAGILPTCLRETKPDGAPTFKLRGAPASKPTSPTQ